MAFDTVQAWEQYAANRIARNFDNLNLVTGPEGVGKSKWMRVMARRSDPGFTIDRIHFTQNSFLEQAVTLNAGDAIQLDEFRGHKRLAMHGDRLEFLDFIKECRGLNLNVWVGYPHVGQVDSDIFQDRVTAWHHLPRRGLTEIRHPDRQLRFTKEGDPDPIVRWPMVAAFPWTKDAHDPLEADYDTKKEARMRDRAARYRETHDAPRPVPFTAPASLLREAAAARRTAGDPPATATG